MKNFFFLGFACLSLQVLGQDPTLKQKTKPTREAPSLHKVMLIPFEPKLYMGEIDRSIHTETK